MLIYSILLYCLLAELCVCLSVDIWHFHVWGTRKSPQVASYVKIKYGPGGVTGI